MPIIEVDHVVKRYRLGQTHNLRQSLARMLGRRPAADARRPSHFNALDGVDFKVEAGEVLGIIGSNGAGKSTLLKVLAGITKPTSGRMVAKGRIAPLIEVGAGLIADLTGRENVYLNGVILGMSVKEIKRKFDDIVGFAELEQFIDTPIKRYSSGMAIRLGFAVATAVESEILIVDEVLAVGDVAFQRKCFDRIENIIKKEGKTILLVSHNIRQVERLCTRTILLDHGRILVDGDARDTCRQFYERTNSKMKTDAAAVNAANPLIAEQNASSSVDLLALRVLTEEGKTTDVVPFRKDFDVDITFRAKRDLRKVLFEVGIHTSDMLYLATHDSDVELKIDLLPMGDYRIRCRFKRPPLVPGVYSLRFGISESDGAHQAFYGENLFHFQISTQGALEAPPGSPHGFFALDAEWERPEALQREAAHEVTLEAA